MSRAAGLFNKDFNHLCFRARIDLGKINNIACFSDIEKQKKIDQKQEIEDSFSEDEQNERANRRDRFKSPEPEPEVGCGTPGFSTTPTDPTSDSNVVLTDTCKGPQLKTRFSKPVDTNTER